MWAAATPQESSRRGGADMRRRTIGLVLIGLGGFALIAALLVRTMLVPVLVKLPLDPDTENGAVGSDVRYLDLEAFKEREAEDVTVEVLVKGATDSEYANDDTAVWAYGSTMKDGAGTTINAGNYIVCLDRKTAEAQECDSASVNEEPASIQGLTATFPLHTQPRDYDLYNYTVQDAFPARYVGAETFHGLSVYRFEQDVPETVVRSTDVPGDLVGSTEESAPADIVYSNSRTILVEPTSGLIVFNEESPQTVLRGADGQTGATFLSGTFRPSEKITADSIARAEGTRGQIRLIETLVPWGLVVLGLVLLAVGIYLVVRSPETSARHAEDGDTRVAVPTA
jgi:hypothetical protein